MVEEQPALLHANLRIAKRHRYTSCYSSSRPPHLVHERDVPSRVDVVEVHLKVVVGAVSVCARVNKEKQDTKRLKTLWVERAKTALR